MYDYNEYWQSDQAMLLYPSNTITFEKKDFREFNIFGDKTGHHACGLGKISIFKAGRNDLDEGIGETIIDWFEGKVTPNPLKGE